VKWIAHLYPGGADIHTTELIGIEEALLGNAFATTEDYIAFGLPVPVFEAKDIWRDFPKIDPYGS
jgi:hypothetical protein